MHAYPHPQEVPPSASAADTLQATPDSLAAEAAADTANALTMLGREVGAASRQLASGDWDAATKLYDGLANLALAFLPRLLSAFFVLVLLYIVYRTLGTLLRKMLSRGKKVDAGLRNLLIKTYRVVALTLIAIMVVAQLGVNVTALLAGLSIAGIAIGFAAQDTVQNFISGVTILMDRPFRIGHFIEVEGIYGTVEEITLRSTRLRTLNHQIMVLPNVQMINQKLINHTMLGVVRIEVPFGIAYKEYPEQAREVVMALTEGDERLHPDYPPTVVVAGLNASSVDMTLRLFLKDPQLEIPVRYEYTEKIREALREADIEIPFPHLQLFIDEAKAFEGAALMQPFRPTKNQQKPSA